MLPERVTPAQGTIITVVVVYMAFSSTMLIINKAAIMFFGLPSTLLWLQMAVSAGLVWILGQVNYLKVDKLEWGKIQAYIGVVVVFIFNLFTNIKAVQYSNVETVIVFQTLTSLAVAYGDFRLLGGGLPSPKIIGSLLIIVVGAVLYVITDAMTSASESDDEEGSGSGGFNINAYLWVGLYFVAKVTDMLYTKHIVDTVPMSSWGRSFYNNFLSLFPVAVMVFISGEHVTGPLKYENGDMDTRTLVMVVLSCIMGLGISISGFKCRELISATSFSVVGNMNKIVTVFINFFVWDAHTTIPGLLCLFICLFGGAYYAKVRQDELDAQPK
eukprot:TRINITY_DN772_c0_g1_i1.p1 TRINITY_DN772_c0_g1~~TRINITY_DN772_c0_g1_i1.p1  ORF type:complete len:328 (-),score=84.94 TRINITY_DN772_c0_g1_i1:87-1070(-)